MATKKKTARKAAKQTGDRKSAVAKRPPSELSANVNVEEDAGAGQENMVQDDYAIPRLTILQDLSPQVKKTEEGYIKGAEAGMICDAVSESIFDGEEGLLIVGVTYRRAYIEWKLRENGGGFVADHGPEGSKLDAQAIRDERGRMILDNGNQIVNAAEYFVFVVDPDNGSFSPYFLAMTSTQLRKAKRWNTMVNQLRVPKANGSGTFNPAIFYRAYRFTTVPERNEQGSWFGWKITGEEDTRNLPGGDEIYLAARDFRKKWEDGNIQAAAPQANGEVEEDDDAPM